MLSNDQNSRIFIREIITSHYRPGRFANPIDNREMKRYDINNLVSGMNAFIRYGKVDEIQAYWDSRGIENQHIESLLYAMRRVDEGTSLCNPGDLESGINMLKDVFANTPKEELPEVEVPTVYTQIGSFDQSIVVADGSLGISLDKYLGSDYPFYQQNYSDRQRRMMVRSMIVPDCLAFYLLSLYPIPLELVNTQKGRDLHMSKIQWVVNEVTEREVFQSDLISAVDHYMKNNRSKSFDDMLRSSSKTIFK
jgi:hypothetical protein